MQKVALRATNGKQHYQEVPFQEQEPSFFNDLLEKITLFCYCGKNCQGIAQFSGFRG